MMSKRSQRWNKKLGLCAGESCDVWAQNFIGRNPKLAYAGTAAVMAGISAYALASVRGKFNINSTSFKKEEE